MRCIGKNTTPEVNGSPALIWATRLRSRRRSRNAGCRRAVSQQQRQFIHPQGSAAGDGWQGWRAIRGPNGRQQFVGRTSLAKVPFIRGVHLKADAPLLDLWDQHVGSVALQQIHGLQKPLFGERHGRIVLCQDRRRQKTSQPHDRGPGQHQRPAPRAG